MGLNYKGSIRVFGVILMLLGFAMTIPTIVSLAFREYFCTKAFTIVFVPCLVVGYFIVSRVTPRSYQLNVRDGAFIISTSWILCSIIGSLPFIISNSIPAPIDAFFETVSGFSTTGATILNDVEAMPKSMLFWRSFTNWLGGLVILQYTISMVPILSATGQQGGAAEVPGAKLSKITSNVSVTAKYLSMLYLTFTLIETVLLKIGGMSFFDAVCHSLSTLGTGGFSTHNENIAYFNSGYIEVVIMIFMFLAGMNFNLFFITVRNGIRSIWIDAEWKIYALIIVISTGCVAINLIINGEYGVLDAIRYAAFQDISLVTTTGFVSTDYGMWPYFAQMALFLLLFIGGCTASSSGGIKCMRFLVLLKLAKRNLSIRLHPNAVIQVKVNDQLLSKDTVFNITNFVFAYIGIGLIMGFLISFDGHDFATTISSVFTCLGNVGPGFVGLGPSFNFNIFSDLSKLIFSFAMIAGRLELFTFLMLFSRKFWNPHH